MAESSNSASKDRGSLLRQESTVLRTHVPLRGGVSLSLLGEVQVV